MNRKFLKDESGSFAVYFAVALSVILLGVSIAIDVSGMHKLRSKYQDMSDAAVLAAAKSRPKQEAAMENVAASVVEKLDITGTPPSTNAILSENKKVLQVHLDGTYKSMMMGIFGKGEIPIQVMSETLLEVGNYTEIVLVLDTTRSMGYEGRLQSLKTAANNFVSVIDEIDSDLIKMSVVPYGQYVNVGTDNREQPWINVPEDYDEPQPDKCTTSRGPVTGQTCETRTTQPSGPTPFIAGTPGTPPTTGTCYDDGVPYSCQTSSGTSGTPDQQATPYDPGGEEYEYCTNTYGPSETTCVAQPPIQHRWFGSVASRSGNYNAIPSWASGQPKSPGFLNVVGHTPSSGRPILPMTTNMASVRSHINSLSVNGATYMPAGLIWGWRQLNPAAPFESSVSLPNGARQKKVMIFMTDGLNTVELDGQFHKESQSRAQADNLTAELCDLIKAEDEYKVYTITFKVMDTTSRDLVKNCATRTDMYFNAQNASSLNTAFEEIGISLMNARITH